MLTESPDLAPSAACVRAWPRFMTSREACDYLREEWAIKRAASTLNKIRGTGGGPRFIKHGRHVRYTPELLDEWANKLISEPLSSTSEAGQK